MRMTTSFLFYDLETTGLNPCFDQILQFAAIRTDLSFNELERIELQVKLNPFVIPHPMAMMTHGMSIEDMQNGISEYEAILKIHALLNTPGTISLGYNTLGFDDEFLRFSFFRHLLTPYTHQYANACGRMDLYPITLLYHLFKPDILNWPQSSTGKVSLKLEALNQANQLAAGQAHHALSDVEATLALAKKFSQEEAMWQYVQGYFNKKTDIERLQTLNNEAIIIRGKFGADQAFQAPALCLGQHYVYKNKVIWLRLDDENLTKTHIDHPAETIRLIHKKYGEADILLPRVAKYEKHLSKERLALCNNNTKWLRENPNILNAIAEYALSDTYPVIPNIDPQAALYQLDFPTAHDQRIMQRFHHARSFEEKENILEELTHPIYQKLGLQLIHPAPLTHPRLDYRGQLALDANSALLQITELENAGALDDRQKKILLSLKDYLA